MTIANMTKEELVYQQILERLDNMDYEMEYKLAVMFGLSEKQAEEEVKTFLAYQRTA